MPRAKPYDPTPFVSKRGFWLRPARYTAARNECCLDGADCGGCTGALVPSVPSRLHLQRKGILGLDRHVACGEVKELTRRAFLMSFIPRAAMPQRSRALLRWPTTLRLGYSLYVREIG